MGDEIIVVEKLGKRYQLRHRRQNGERYKALRDVLAGTVRSVGAEAWRRATGIIGFDRGEPIQAARGQEEEFWALREVDFSVAQGEVVGIVGRNGAGKSTLLKILSRITEPSVGRVCIDGRAASLLEVGTGFHPELTGRENIFLNGTILGMKRQEIRRRFDEIVAFAEVERFLDTPVKRYSSGMYVRLAFAVAAHLEPEILIVDEVLAVGDADFQRKCLGRMKSVSMEGRTVLFVSHNMAAVSRLCTRCLLLSEGKLKDDGKPDYIVGRYLGMVADEGSGMELGARLDREGTGEIRFTAIRTESIGNERSSIGFAGSPLSISLTLKNSGSRRQCIVHVAILSVEGEKLLHLDNGSTNSAFSLDHGEHRISCTISRLPLVQGTYVINVAVTDSNGCLQDRVESAARLEILGGDYFGSGRLSEAKGAKFYVDHEWRSTTD
jgi:lipopolysaccharide transport system ATP-binding protein